MRAYGIPRCFESEHPDKADIKKYGISATDRCSRKDRGKNKSRRTWKKRQRKHYKRETISFLNETA